MYTRTQHQGNNAIIVLSGGQVRDGRNTAKQIETAPHVRVEHLDSTDQGRLVPYSVTRQTAWRQFEDLVHEMFRTEGYAVVQTGAGPDGGIDLKLKKGAVISTVQCKHWRTKKVDVKTVREQLGVMTASGADNCFVVTTGEYTDAAKKFARGQPITLIDRTSLREQLATLGGDRSEMPSEMNRAEPVCPRCNSRMVENSCRTRKTFFVSSICSSRKKLPPRPGRFTIRSAGIRNGCLVTCRLPNTEHVRSSH